MDEETDEELNEALAEEVVGEELFSKLDDPPLPGRANVLNKIRLDFINHKTEYTDKPDTQKRSLQRSLPNFA